MLTPVKPQSPSCPLLVGDRLVRQAELGGRAYNRQRGAQLVRGVRHEVTLPPQRESDWLEDARRQYDAHHGRGHDAQRADDQFIA